MRGLALLVLALAWAVPAAAEEMPVDLELILAVDISGSVDETEAEQQRAGYVSALSDPAVIQAIGANFHRRIAVAYVEWAGAETQQTTINWTLIDGAAAAMNFAATLASRPRTRAMWTSISEAIAYCVPMFARNDFAGERQVIDISGDGTNNRGRSVNAARDAAVAMGITINGLPILNDRPQPFDGPTPVQMGLDRYYTEQVIGGPGAFIEPAADFAAFRDAILRKLIREIAGAGVPPTRLAGR